MNNGREKDRDISILEYFKALQQEYLYFEVKSKIYPSSKDKAYFKKVMEYKKNKIEDISNKNNLDSIFNSEAILEDFVLDFFDEFGNPKRLGKRDWYFYYKLGSDFSYDGKGVKLRKYDLDLRTAEIELESGETKEVGLDEISRIL